VRGPHLRLPMGPPASRTNNRPRSLSSPTSPWRSLSPSLVRVPQVTPRPPLVPATSLQDKCFFIPSPNLMIARDCATKKPATPPDPNSFPEIAPPCLFLGGECPVLKTPPLFLDPTTPMSKRWSFERRPGLLIRCSQHPTCFLYLSPRPLSFFFPPL